MSFPNFAELDDDALVQRALDLLWRHVKDKYRPKINHWNGNGGQVTPGMRYFVQTVLAPPEQDEHGDLVLPDIVYASWQEYCVGDIDDLPETEFIEILSLCKAINERLE